MTNSNFTNNGQGTDVGAIFISADINRVDQTNRDMHHINFTFRKLLFYHNNDAAWGSCLNANVFSIPKKLCCKFPNGVNNSTCKPEQEFFFIKSRLHDS